MTYKISPSMMCCDFFDLKAQVRTFEEKEVELLHIDIMDGAFVPNIALGADFVKQLKKATDIPLDLHFMVESPERLLSVFPIGAGDHVSIHRETTHHPRRALATCKALGARAFLALNPASPLALCEEITDDIDGLLIMTVDPGFAGQKLIPATLDKIARARRLLDGCGRTDAEIAADGNVSIENAIRMREAGANIFVLGTSALFGGAPLSDNIDTFRRQVFAD